MRSLSDVILDQKPLILRDSATVQSACVAMRDARAGSVVVTDAAGRLSGIFTGRDAVARVLAEGRDAATTTLAEVMTRDPMILKPEQSAIDALRVMWDGGFRHVPRVRDGRVLGVVSRGDFKGYEYHQHDEERDLWEHMR